MAELSYRCKALVEEKAKLEREKVRVLEKVGLLASERHYLKNNIAASGKALTAPEKAESPTSRPWRKRIFG